MRKFQVCLLDQSFVKETTPVKKRKVYCFDGNIVKNLKILFSANILSLFEEAKHMNFAFKRTKIKLKCVQYGQTRPLLTR